MDAIFDNFSHAQRKCDGNLLSQTLTGDLTNDQLRGISKTCNAYDAKDVIKHGLRASDIGKSGAIPKEELKGWIDVYAAYWKSVGELLAVRDTSSDNGKVSAPHIISNRHLTRSIAVTGILGQGIRKLERAALSSDQGLQLFWL